MLQNFIPTTTATLTWLVSGFLGIFVSPNLIAQTSGTDLFFWDPEKISEARRDLFTRANGSVLFEIPVPGNPIQYHIRAHSLITRRSEDSEEKKAFQSFRGTDSLGNTVYGYFYKDRLSFSYYHHGRLYSISPGEKEGLYVRTSMSTEAEGVIECGTLDIPQVKVRAGGNSIPCQTQNFTTLTFDLHLACTGEWGKYYNNNKSSAIIALLDHGMMLNAFYGGEMGIQFNLITDDNTTYTDPDTDPFDPDNTRISRADQARFFFNENVPDDTYDIGHVMHRRAGTGLSASGVAYLHAVCNGEYRGGGWTGTTVPDNESFTFLVFGHEIGHQLGANHSFYGNAGNCSEPNRSAKNGFEPGSGSSFMSYAGQCGGHNLDGPPSQTFYFNTHSINEILNYLNTSGCGTKSGSGSRLSVQMPSDFSVPLHTAFDLTATGEGAFNYNWEQYDTDGKSNHSDPMEAGMYTGTPMYRSYDPSSTGYHRSFPSKNAQHKGVSRGEVYADVPRDITLRLTTRAGGAVQCDEMTVTVRDAPPLQILEPLGGDLIELSRPSVRSSHLMTVRWETGDTENHGFPTVDILFSTDGGATFSLVAEGVTNDGEHEVQPPAETNQARLKIVLSDGTDRMAIYHESPENFTVAFSILPIQIAAFTGRELEDYHQLSWTLHNTGEIVRSVQLEYGYDGIGFRGIPLNGYEVLNATATWSDTYDSRFIQGAQTYYRLAVVNINGHTTYSPVIRLNKTTGNKEFWSLFPNPAHQEVRLDFDTYLHPEATITLYSINGQKMMVKAAGNQAKSHTLPLSYPEGLYIVEVNNGGDFHRKKLVIASGE